MYILNPHCYCVSYSTKYTTKGFYKSWMVAPHVPKASQTSASKNYAALNHHIFGLPFYNGLQLLMRAAVL